MRIIIGLYSVLALVSIAQGQISSLLQHPAVRAAMAYIEREDEQTLRMQAALTEVPAPPFGEARRAAVFADSLRRLGLQDVHIDEEGNVIGFIRGRAPRPLVVLSAHLDTVFPEETDVRVRRSGNRLEAPGISDDGRGLAVIWMVARAIQAARIPLEGTLAIVGTVGEEGIGDLRGVKYLFQRSPLRDQIDYFISVDGAGLGTVTHQALGSKRFRVTFRGPGGHSWGAFGTVNPIHALGRALARIAELPVPATPRTSFNVGRIGGGTSVNSIPYEAWMEIDLRSESPEALAEAEAHLRRYIQQAVEEENAYWPRSRGRIEVEIAVIGDRPSGEIPADHEIVRAASEVITYLGGTPRLGRSSTDANIPIALGIPAVTIGGGGRGGNAHALDEWYENDRGHLGVQQALLLALRLVGLQRR
jgi:tripeptide aminopeptidase|nr:MAG: peptidase M20 [Bacteroidota bacterium]